MPSEIAALCTACSMLYTQRVKPMQRHPGICTRHSTQGIAIFILICLHPGAVFKPLLGARARPPLKGDVHRDTWRGVWDCREKEIVRFEKRSIPYGGSNDYIINTLRGKQGWSTLPFHDIFPLRLWGKDCLPMLLLVTKRVSKEQPREDCSVPHIWRSQQNGNTLTRENYLCRRKASVLCYT